MVFSIIVLKGIINFSIYPIFLLTWYIFMFDIPLICMNHCLTNLDYNNMTAVCSVCGPTKFALKGRDDRPYNRECITRVKEKAKRYRESVKGKAAMARGYKKYFAKNGTKSVWRKYVKMECELCGFKAVHPDLIDGHHKDGNRKNNNPDNIQSLCNACHRLVHRNLQHLIRPYGSTGILVEAAPNKSAEEFWKNAALNAKEELMKMVKIVEEAKANNHKGDSMLIGSAAIGIGSLKAELEESRRYGREMAALVSKLEEEVKLFEKRREAWLKATESQQVAYWMNRCLKVEKAMIRGEYDQTM